MQEYNDRYSQTSIEFIKHFESALSLPQSLFKQLSQAKRRRGKTDENDDDFLTDNLWKIYSHWVWEQPAHYLTKELLIEKSLLRIGQIAKEIANITWIPESFLWVKQNTQITATQTMYERDNFHKKIISRQSMVKNEMQRLFWYLVYMKNNTNEFVFPNIDFKIPNPRDIESLSKTYALLKTSWFVSDKTAMKDLFWRDDDKIEKEIEEINAQNEIISAIEWNQFLQ